MRTISNARDPGHALIRYHDSTRVINSAKLEMRYVDIVLDGALKESAEYARSRLYGTGMWHQFLQEALERGIAELAGMAMQGEEHDGEVRE